MKILFIVPYAIFPADEGGRVRAYNLVRQLARAHEVTVLTPRSPGNRQCDLSIAVRETTAPGRRRQIVSARFLLRAGALARELRPELVISEVAWPALHAAYLAKRAGAKLVVDMQNVEGERFRATGSRAWRFVDAYERLAVRLASRVLVVSEEDRRTLLRRGVREEKVVLAPNGVDAERLRPDAGARAAMRSQLGVGDATRVLLFFGQLDYAPNAEALSMIRDELLPRFDAAGADYRLVVAGKGGDAARASLSAQPRATWLGRVDDIAGTINGADAVLVPIRAGGGTRLKVLEAIACGAPVVSTSAGAEGIDREVCGGMLRIEDEWGAFARAALDPGLTWRASRPAGFVDAYGWESIVGRVDWASFAG